MSEKSEKEKIKSILASREKQYKRQNDFVKNNYDRVAVLLPHGVKDRIKKSGFSVNAFCNDAIIEKLDRMEL
jgi:hypothetical protein